MAEEIKNQESQIVAISDKKSDPKQVVCPLVPLREIVMFPFLEVVLSFGRVPSIRAVEESFKSNRLVFFATQKNPTMSDPEEEDLYTVGVVCRVERLLKTGNELNALVKGLYRARVVTGDFNRDFPIVKTEAISEFQSDSTEIKAVVNVITNALKKLVNMGKPIDFLVFMKLMSGVTYGELADQISSILDLPVKEKQKMLEEPDVTKRLKKINALITKETKVFEIEQSIASKAQKKFDQSMREAVLRERMKTIQEELGTTSEIDDYSDPEIVEFRTKLKKNKLPEEVAAKVKKEIARLAKMHSYNPESGYIRTYLETVFDLPWGKYSKTEMSQDKAQKVLDEDHYGLEEVKERILEYLAVMELKKTQGDQQAKGSSKYSGPTILCFVGPPGVGKTSIGRSIAHALGRKFIKVSIGGIRDEAEIRGHRRTYVGAMPGRIVNGIKEAGTLNPVFMLDEIDKMSSDFHGDPSAALLEALDPEQNFAFSDHYLELPFDLSQVMFITTANVLDTIPAALKDRLEIIRFSGYTDDEKLNIAKKYLVPKTEGGSGLLKKQVTVQVDSLKKIIRGYTKESGVRGLERELNKIMRKIAKKIADKKLDKETITGNNVHDYLGPVKFLDTLVGKEDEVGMSTGLAWTSVGGEILFIEVAAMPGKGRLKITGKIGDVMKESCEAALTYIRSHWKELKLDKDLAAELDFHVHVPEGATPKDGPSAGGAITVALYSAIANKKVRKDVAMTGEVTLRGNILEIGGLKEKLIAAHRSGIKKVIIPFNNQKDLEKIPENVTSKLQIIPAKTVDVYLKEALVG